MQWISVSKTRTCPFLGRSQGSLFETVSDQGRLDDVDNWMCAGSSGGGSANDVPDKYKQC